MSRQTASRVEDVERGLSARAVQLDRKSPRQWSWVMSNGASHHLEIQLDGDWLLFTADHVSNTRTISPESLWSALQQNAKLPAGIKVAVKSPKRLLLRSELLLADDVDVEQRVRGVINAFGMFWENHPPQATDETADWIAELEQRCEESGWASVRRSTGRLTVALQTTPALHATLTPVGRGVRLCVDATDFSSCPEVCRAAAAALSLETSGRVRMVRAVADEGQARIRFETLLADPPLAAELDAGFSGLSAAIAVTSDALGALQNENVARDYLAIRGWTADVPNPKPERTNT